MSGHSKWANIKHKKEANDKSRGVVFAKLSKLITLAVIEGGGIGDPIHNNKLRIIVEKAKISKWIPASEGMTTSPTAVIPVKTGIHFEKRGFLPRGVIYHQKMQAFTEYHIFFKPAPPESPTPDILSPKMDSGSQTGMTTCGASGANYSERSTFFY